MFRKRAGYNVREILVIYTLHCSIMVCYIRETLSNLIERKASSCDNNLIAYSVTMIRMLTTFDIFSSCPTRPFGGRMKLQLVMLNNCCFSQKRSYRIALETFVVGWGLQLLFTACLFKQCFFSILSHCFREIRG